MSSQSEAAAHVCMSVTAFKQLLDRGVVTKANGRSYNLNTVREEYILYIRQIASGRGGGQTDGLNPLAERARKDKEMADRVALQNAATRGELAPVSEFQDVLEDAFVRFRSRIVAAPSKLAPRLEGASRTEIKEIIKLELEEALEEIRSTKFVPKTNTRLQEHDLPDEEDEK